MPNLQSLLDDTECYETVHELRWPTRVCCPHCASTQVSKQGCDASASAAKVPLYGLWVLF